MVSRPTPLPRSWTGLRPLEQSRPPPRLPLPRTNTSPPPPDPSRHFLLHLDGNLRHRTTTRLLHREECPRCPPMPTPSSSSGRWQKQRLQKAGLASESLPAGHHITTRRNTFFSFFPSSAPFGRSACVCGWVSRLTHGLSVQEERGAQPPLPSPAGASCRFHALLRACPQRGPGE